MRDARWFKRLQSLSCRLRPLQHVLSVLNVVRREPAGESVSYQSLQHGRSPSELESFWRTVSGVSSASKTRAAASCSTHSQKSLERTGHRAAKDPPVHGAPALGGTLPTASTRLRTSERVRGQSFFTAFLRRCARRLRARPRQSLRIGFFFLSRHADGGGSLQGFSAQSSTCAAAARVSSRKSVTKKSSGASQSNVCAPKIVSRISGHHAAPVLDKVGFQKAAQIQQLGDALHRLQRIR